MIGIVKGGQKEVTITYVRPDIKERIGSIIVKEFQGINDLPDEVSFLQAYSKFKN